MVGKEFVRTSYADNKIGSGQYCKCGSELTYEENRDYRYKKACIHKRKKAEQRFVAIGRGRHYD